MKKNEIPNEKMRKRKNYAFKKIKIMIIWTKLKNSKYFG